ncbi:MAG: response regulator [Bacteroidales bacterium]|nr:response regulator [Bacteroidales bacterium]
MIFLLVEALRHTKAKLIRVKNGVEAVEFCKSNSIDLILMDINMPEMDGFEATRQIKSMRRDIPVIVQTAMNSEDEEDESKKAGADDFISKPIDLKTFIAKLEKYLN